jgi:nucleoside-diphosphate-sugar epimerase
MSRVLLTGATGFVGRHLAVALASAGYTVRAALRAPALPPAACAESVVSGDLGSDPEWHDALRDVDQVMHVAARAHAPGRDSGGAELCMRINARATQRLADAAAAAGVGRFVLLSSVKVNGEGTRGHAYSAADLPQPGDSYARSKWAAEQQLTEISNRSAMQAVIVRAPLVYGPGVRANFLRLLRWVDGGWPLPFGAVRNARSLVSIWNLCDLLVNITSNPAAPNRTWMVADGEDLSTPQLMVLLGRALQRPVHLLSVPPPLLRAAAAALGRTREIARLCDSLTVDVAPTRTLLGWSPPLAVEEALQRTAAWYRAARPRA